MSTMDERIEERLDDLVGLGYLDGELAKHQWKPSILRILIKVCQDEAILAHDAGFKEGFDDGARTALAYAESVKDGALPLSPEQMWKRYQRSKDVQKAKINLRSR